MPAHRRGIGHVPQEGALFPHLSILDNIRFGITGRTDGEAQALKLMDLVELDRSMASRSPTSSPAASSSVWRWRGRWPSSRACCCSTSRSSALDSELREHLRRATADILSRANVATILVTHDRDEAMGFADQLVVLRNGRLAQAGVPRELYLTPVDEGVASFLGAAIILDAEVRDGRASTALGDLDLPQGQQGPGMARVLLRPEQLQLAPAVAASDWTLQSATCVGPTAHVTVSGPRAAPIIFDTTTIGLPENGAPVAITVSGPAHRFS